MRNMQQRALFENHLTTHLTTISFPQDNTEDDTSIPSRKVAWKLSGRFVAETKAGYATGPPMFEEVFPVPIKHFSGEMKMVRFSHQLLWDIIPVDATKLEVQKPPPAKTKRGPGRPRRQRRNKSASEEEQEQESDEDESDSEGDSHSEEDFHETEDPPGALEEEGGRGRKKKPKYLFARQRALENGGFEYLEFPAQFASSRSSNFRGSCSRPLFVRSWRTPEEARLEKRSRGRKFLGSWFPYSHCLAMDLSEFDIHDRQDAVDRRIYYIAASRLTV
jgi:hypothetical protein